MLKYIIETAPLGTRYVVAAKDPENGSVVQVFTLNKTAAHMLELFSQGLPTAEVAERIAREYKAPLDLVKRAEPSLLRFTKIVSEFTKLAFWDS